MYPLIGYAREQRERTMLLIVLYVVGWLVVAALLIGAASEVNR